MLKDDNKTMQELGIKEGTKIMLIGSTLNDIMTASAPPPQQQGESKIEGNWNNIYIYLSPKFTFLQMIHLKKV